MQIRNEIKEFKKTPSETQTSEDYCYLLRYSHVLWYGNEFSKRDWTRDEKNDYRRRQR